MYEFLNGQITSIGEDYCIMDCNGIGYRLIISKHFASHLQNLKNHRDKSNILTHFAVTENNQTLYGFENETERALFRRLIQVTGIGPNSAINLLSSLSPNEMVSAILSGDTQRLTSMKGVGKKTAERLIIELKDHLKNLIPANISSPNTGELYYLTKVLKDLGFSPTQAEAQANAAVNELGTDCDFQDLLRFALNKS